MECYNDNPLADYHVKSTFGDGESKMSKTLKKYHGCRFFNFQSLLDMDRTLDVGKFCVTMSTPDNKLYLVQGNDIRVDIPKVLIITDYDEKSKQVVGQLALPFSTVKVARQVETKKEINDNGKVKL